MSMPLLKVFGKQEFGDWVDDVMMWKVVLNLLSAVDFLPFIAFVIYIIHV